MKIAIIDADVIGKKKHRFPNLASMKISAYQKQLGNDTALVFNYDDLKTQNFDKIYLSKVFTATLVPDWVLKLPNIEYGGTGFYYDKAPKLPNEVEHIMPDYHLYDEWVNTMIQNGANEKEFTYYKDYSIGFTTRGCFRQCQFCVNRNYKSVAIHSPLDEFFDKTRKKICLLDDNVLGSPCWKEIFMQLQATGRPFQYKQGMDERILTDEKCRVLFNSKYDGDYIFAFDNIADYDLIEKKLILIRQYTNKYPKFYVFCGFDRNDKWDKDFWRQDIFDMMKRIELLQKYHCLPYIMRYERYIESPYQGVYKTVAAWCNQPSFFKKKSLREFGLVNGLNSARNKYITEFESLYEDFQQYMDLKWDDIK